MSRQKSNDTSQNKNFVCLRDMIDKPMKPSCMAVIELRDLVLQTDIGTFGPGDTPPDVHLLDLTLGVDAGQVLISRDGMAHVFDYDPLIVEIDRLAADGHYETQERLLTRIAAACAVYSAIKTIEISLKKLPVRLGNGSLGIRLFMDEASTDELRRLSQLT